MAIGNAGYSEKIGQSVNQPKEVGLLQRADGLRGDLQSLRARIESFYDRIEGSGDANAKPSALIPVPSSLAGTFSEAENELRLCLQIMDSIDSRF